MKVLILFLLIPLTALADTPPSCEKLAQILRDYEVGEGGLQKKFVGSPGNTCQNLKISDLGDENLVNDKSLFEKYRCSSLSVIEAELENLKNQEAVLAGIDKLKASIQASQQETGSANQQVAREAGMSFVSSLNTAQSFEVLLQSQTKGGSPFLTELKKFPEADRNTPEKFAAKIQELCKDVPTDQALNACDKSHFSPNADAIRELNALLAQTEPTASQIDSWKGMMRIRKKDVAEGEEATYSFTEMQGEIGSVLAKLESGAQLEKSDLATIQRLNKFENAPGLSFVEDLGLAKNKFKNQLASDRFSFLMGDAKKRQEYEVQSKISIAWAEVKTTNLSENEINACESAKGDYQSAMACITVLEKMASEQLQGDAKNHLLELLAPVNASIAYHNKLDSVSKNCLAQLKTTKTMPENCFDEINKDKAKLQEDILSLNLIKDRIGAENQDNMKFRNFALYKWETQKCGVIDTNIDFCEAGVGIAKEAKVLASNMLDIALVFEPKPDAETVVMDLCDDSNRTLKSREEELCKFFNDTTSNVVETDNAPKADPSDSTVTPGTREGKEREAWLGGLRTGLDAIAQQLIQQRRSNLPPAVSPYPFNYAPYGGGKPMGIADSILFNARFQGAYGFYMPTAGYTPGTAFGSSASAITPYKAASVGGSSYFGR